MYVRVLRQPHEGKYLERSSLSRPTVRISSAEIDIEAVYLAFELSRRVFEFRLLNSLFELEILETL